MRKGTRRTKQVVNIPKPHAMSARFALAHRFKDRKKEASRKACRGQMKEF